MTETHLYEPLPFANIWGMSYICFETRVFLLADQLRDRKGYSESGFARQAWGQHGYRKWRRHKRKAENGEGARLSINDALGLAFALGMDLSDLLSKAEREARLDNQPMQPFYPNQPRNEGGDEAKNE